MRGVVGAIIVSVFWAVWVTIGAIHGSFQVPVAIAAIIWVILCGGFFVTLIKTELNLRLPDNSLSTYCLLAANFGVLVAMHYGPENLRAASYLWAIIAFSVANLSSSFHSVRLTAAIVVAMGLLEGLLQSTQTGIVFDIIWQLAAFCAAVLFIAYAIVVVGKKAAASNRKLEHSALVLDTISEAVFTLDSFGSIQSLNHAAVALSGSNIQHCVGKPLNAILRATSDQDAQIINNIGIAASDVRPSRRRIEANWNQFSIQVNRDEQEQSIKFESHIRLVSDNSGKAPRQVVVLRDISHISMLLRKLQHESTHDDLTGLLNRRGLSAEFQELTEQMSKQQATGEHALLVLDLDKFKVINDTCGHSAGDQLLKEVSLILTNAVREGDRVARQGGDEFAVLMRATSQEEVNEVAKKILQGVAQLDFQWTRRKFQCSASIGASIINRGSLDINQAVLRADSALFLAKELGRGRFQMYREDDANILKKTRQLAWATRIHQALADNHFELFGQQVKALASENAEHYEILLRLPNARHGFDSPEDFMPSAERFELMPLIDRWVISRAISAIGAQPIATQEIKMRISVNLSAQSLLDLEFAPFLQKTLLESKFSPDNLYFEIAEAIAVENTESVRRFIDEMRLLGCHVALDEVGNGYNSRIELRELKCDFIKLDSQFTRDLESNFVNQELVASIFKFAQTAKVKTVAKKVERPATVAALKSIGIGAMQGYWIHKPEPLRAILGRKALIARVTQTTIYSDVEVS
jgi:diguanylate cyclase (GGDEF)-like protein